MALASKLGNLLKQAVTSNPSLYQAIRCMSSSKVFVGGLSYGTDDQSLRESFTGFGEVVEARVIVDRDTGRSRGFGFVTFTSGEEASAAISGMDGKDLHGRIVRVNYATDRTGGFRGGGGYGGGGSGYGGSGGGYSGGGGYGGNTGGYGSVGGSFGGYGGGSGGENYPTAGGTGGSSSSYVSGASGNNFGSSGGFYSDNATTQSNSNFSGRDGSYGNDNQDDLLEDNFKDADDEPEDYAKRG
ncbi:glycine-rich RNA-binding protein 2, mitochondrial [Musa acuminata AAA Group]|uniref:glycine-rich RNA-binding protein 2, mitochondrial n=1 Tax=Musa acuminata AAA Group TaxID=214697 RepID=UPI0031DF51CD